MRVFVRLLLLAIALGSLPACKSPLQLYTTRYPEMRDDNPPRLTVFESGERAAIVVDLPKGCGWGETVGTMWVDDAVSGRTVWSQSQFMQEGYTHYFVPEGLKPGTYVATLRAEGEVKASANFDVR